MRRAWLGLPFGLVVAACGASRDASIGPPVVQIPSRTTANALPHDGPGSPGLPPPPLASKEAPFPKVHREKLASGLDVAIAEAHALPLVQVRVLVHAGGGFGGLAGAAELTLDLLKDGGTRTKSSAEVLERITRRNALRRRRHG
jgi:zinc protease